MKALKQIFEKHKGRYFGLHHFRKLFLLCNELKEKDDRGYGELITKVGKFHLSEFIETVNNYVLDPEILSRNKITSIRKLKDVNIQNESLKRIISIFIENWLSQEFIKTDYSTVKTIQSLIFSIQSIKNIEILGKALLGFENQTFEKVYTESHVTPNFDKICKLSGVPLENKHPLKRLCPHCDFQEGLLECIEFRNKEKLKHAERLEEIYQNEGKSLEERIYCIDVHLSLGKSVCRTHPVEHPMINNFVGIENWHFSSREEIIQLRKLLIIKLLSISEEPYQRHLLRPVCWRYVSVLREEQRSMKNRNNVRWKKKGEEYNFSVHLDRTKDLKFFDGNSILFKVSSEMKKVAIWSSFSFISPSKTLKYYHLRKENSPFKLDYHFWGTHSNSLLSICFGVPLIGINSNYFVYSHSKDICQVIKHENFQGNKTINLDNTIKKKTIEEENDDKYVVSEPSPNKSFVFILNLREVSPPPFQTNWEKYYDVYNHSLLSLLEYKGVQYIVCCEDVLFTISLIDLSKQNNNLNESVKLQNTSNENNRTRLIFRGHEWSVFGVDVSEQLEILVSCDGISIRIWDFETAVQLFQIFNVPLCSKIRVYDDDDKCPKIYSRFQKVGVKEFSIPQDIRRMSKTGPFVEVVKIDSIFSDASMNQSLSLVNWFTKHRRLFYEYNDHYGDFTFYDFQVTKYFLFLLGEERKKFSSNNNDSLKSYRQNENNINNKKMEEKGARCVKVFSRSKAELVSIIHCSRTPKPRFRKIIDWLQDENYHRIDAYKHFFVISVFNTVKLYDLFSNKKQPIKQWKFELPNNSTEEEKFKEKGILMLKIIPMKRKLYDCLGFYIYASTKNRLFQVFFSYKKKCKWCQKVPVKKKLKCCSRCSRTFYCSRKCQAEDWKRHKTLCSKL